MWAKVIYYIAESVLVGYTIAQYDYGSQAGPIGSVPGDLEAGSWRKFVMHYENTISGDAADDQYFSIDVVNITNGAVDGTWTDEDYDYVMQTLAGMCNALNSDVASYLTFKQVLAYIRAFNPYSNSKPFADSGPPDRILAANAPGAGQPNVAPQACTTITELTPSPKHWGRMYSPTLGVTSYGSSGRLSTATIDAIANNVHDRYETLMSAQYFPVVPTTQSDKQPARTLQTVTGVQVDDVPDVIRRRRHKNTLSKVTLPLATAQQQPASE